jgi:hypothetical protein
MVNDYIFPGDTKDIPENERFKNIDIAFSLYELALYHDRGRCSRWGY